MDVPRPATVAAMATFVRERLSDVGLLATDLAADAIAPLLRQLPGAGTPVVTTVRPDSSTVAALRDIAVVVAGAAAPFAPNAYARARLIRQLHATGLLTGDDALRVSRATALLDGPFPAEAVVDAASAERR